MIWIYLIAKRKYYKIRTCPQDHLTSAIPH